MALEDEARDAILEKVKKEAPTANYPGLKMLAEAYALVMGGAEVPGKQEGVEQPRRTSRNW